MNFTVRSAGSNPLRDAAGAELIEQFRSRGARLLGDVSGINFVLDLIDAERPRAYRRHSKSVFVITLASIPKRPDNFRSWCYTTLVRTFSNLSVCLVPNSTNGQSPLLEASTVHFTTPEAGFYAIPYDARQLYERVLPIASSHYATDNSLHENLPERLWRPSPVVREIAHYGRVLDSLGVLPTPFPLKALLSPEDLHHLYRVFGITGASYGNLSAREEVPEFGRTAFWMTGRGVNKANLSQVGKDVLLVTAFDHARGVAHCSVPPGTTPRARVSVDAVEHSLIYEAFPEVGAIIHVHAWIEGVPATRQNYPCGTLELAREVAELLRCQKDPASAVVGLKNHGLTITGRSLGEIFERISGRLRTEVPMIA